MHGRILTGAIVLSVALAVPLAAQPQHAAVRHLLQAYVATYQEKLTSLVVSERYEQTGHTRRGGAPVRRLLLSELLMVRTAAGREWMMFRDVLEVDGRPLPQRSERLLALLTGPAPDAMATATRLAAESARYNLGEVPRTTNVPDLALAYLRAEHADRILIERVTSERLDGKAVAMLQFRETSGPTIIRGPNDIDQPARGRIWFSADTGVIWRTELYLRDRISAATHTVTFRHDLALGWQVPASMTERYSTARQEVDARATYSNPRTFQVRTGMKLQ